MVNTSAVTVGSRNHSVLEVGRLDKTVEVEPLVALMHTDAWARPFAHPDASENGFESNPMLIGRPELNRRLGKGLLERVHLLWKFFLNAS